MEVRVIVGIEGNVATGETVVELEGEAVVAAAEVEDKVENGIVSRLHVGSDDSQIAPCFNNWEFGKGTSPSVIITMV